MAELERNLLAERTKSGLLEARRNKKILGRPKNSLVLLHRQQEFQQFYQQKYSISFLVKYFKVTRATVYKFIQYLQQRKDSKQN